MASLNRRHFVVSAAAGAFALGWGFPRLPAAQQAGSRAVGIWVVIDPDDTTTVRIARSEMGQGTLTGLAQLVAEELDADWDKIRWEYVAPEVNLASKRAWGDMSTGGSRGLRGSVDYVRQGGAAARAMLMQAAAARWGVPVSECRTREGAVLHGDKRLRYGALAEDAARLPVPEKVALKPESDWRIIGQPLPRLDTEEKLNGSAQFAIDVRLPGMLSASLAQSPVFGAKLVRFDADAIKSMPGVRHVLPVGDAAVAVVADTWWQANQALKKLPITWSETPNQTVSSAAIAEHLRGGLDAPDGGVGHRGGDAAAALAGAAKRIEATYGTPFLNHATLEPMNCTALVDGGECEIWVGTQNGDAALAAAAEAAGVKLTDVKVHKYLLGGGFGRRGQQDFTRFAVLLAKQIPGTPVKLLWSREEDMQHDFYRPISMCKLEGGLDANGNLAALRMRVSGQSINAWLRPDGNPPGVDMRQLQGLGPEEFGYLAIPNFQIEYAMRNTHVPVGPWRGVNLNQNAVYIECFIDELAHAAGRDPLEFRQAIMAKNPLHLAVLNATARRAGWGTPTPPGVYRGIAQQAGYGSYTAAVAEVSVSPEGRLKIHKITAGTDPGHVVNPDQVRAQVEGSFVYGLSAALYSEITIESGRVVQGNFDTYQVARMQDMPVVDTVMVPSGGFWGGVGEPTISVASPAVLNAIFAATGKRIRSLPIGEQDLRRT
ncbi:MAG TPA: molybdopterin cofactor-binding domain-containing protein [Acetobacteraceae bacterium]|nr:molybdopterin cofactor-binding domain-containing protein [Acetobacteraceae bacterium]